MQSETQLYETVASGCQIEHNREVYQELILCHQSNTRSSDCSQPCNDVNICDHSRNVHHNNDVTDASDFINCCCAGAKALELDASSRAKCLKRDAEYMEIVDDNGACSDSKPSIRQAYCHHQQHDNNSLQPVAEDDYLQPVDQDEYVQPVAYDDYLQQVALDFSNNTTDCTNASSSSQGAPTTTAQPMSDYSTTPESVDDPFALSVYNEINPSQMYNDIVAVPSTPISSVAFDVEVPSLSSQPRKLQLKRLCAAVSVVVLLLVIAAGCVWLVLHIFLLPPSTLAKKVAVAFCATRHRPLDDLSDGLIVFDTVNINEGSAFDHSRLSARQSSYYWLAASAGLNTKDLTSLLLHQQRSSVRAATELAPSQQDGVFVLKSRFTLGISLFDIRLLDTDNTVHLTSKQTIDATRSVANMSFASFLGFSINGIFDQLVAIKYEIDSTMTRHMTVIDGKSVVSVSKSDKTGMEDRFFIRLQVPVSGVYLIATSIHCTTNHQVNSSTKVNSLFVTCNSLSSTMETTLAGLSLSKRFDTHVLQNDYVASTSALVNLAANDDQNLSGQFSGTSGQFSGTPDISLVRYAVQLVLYKPVNADNTVAWSVVIASLANKYNRSTTLVKINEGGAYNNVSDSVIMPVTGVYYLMLTVYIPVASPSRHRVMLNANTTVLEISHPRSTVFFDEGFGTTDKSIMLSLATDDLLTYHFSLTELSTPLPSYTSFSGFLLYPKQ